MNVISAIKSSATVREKEVFLNRLHNDLISDLWLIYGRLGNAPRKEKIALIARCKKTAAEKREAMKRILHYADQREALFAGLGDKELLAACIRTARRVRTWKGELENEKKN